LDPNAGITVVGAGLTGIETAAELAEQGRRVTMVCGGRLAPTFSEPARRSIAKWLAKHGVDVLEGAVAAEVRRDAVVLAEGAVLPSAVTVWAAGFGVPELAARSGLRTDALGRLLTDETLTSVDDRRVVAAGDAASPSGQPLRMSCYAAGPLGVTAADTVLSRIAGVEPARLDMAYVGASVSLGRRAATGQFTHMDDTPVNWHFGGRTAAFIKEAACKATLWAIRREGRKPGSTFWLKGGPRPSQPVLVPDVPTNR
jgi:NADH:quinone reductase (non-electrogenic)